MGTCNVSVRFRSIVKCVHFYVVPDKLKPIIGVSDALTLGLTSFHCPIYNDWQSNSDLNIDSVNSNSNSANHTGKVNSTFTMGTLAKQAIINNLKYACLHSRIGQFQMQTSAHHHETKFNTSSEASQKGANCHKGQIQAGT